MTPRIPFRATQGAFNNMRAAGEQAAAQRGGAGAGLSRGRGQRYMDSMRGGAAMADGFHAGMQARLQDAYQNAGFAADQESLAANENLAFRRIAEQRRNSEWDSRFSNLNTAWGALAGLLR